MPGLKHATGIFTGKIRRFFIVHFRKTYMTRQLQHRQGDCHQCGTCCHFSIACPLLTTDKLCRVYGKCRPKACKVFPIDQHDIDDVTACGGACGYRFTAPTAGRKAK